MIKKMIVYGERTLLTQYIVHFSVTGSLHTHRWRGEWGSAHRNKSKIICILWLTVECFDPVRPLMRNSRRDT